MNYASVLPRNTIIAQKIRDDTAKPMFVFPFFPSHVSFPCKPGETVWTMVENPEAKFIDIAYWLCRVVEPHHVDDVNHTHSPRIQETSNFPTLKQRQVNDGVSSAKYELRNGIAVTKGGERGTKASSFYIPGTEDIFEKLITDTDAAKMMQYESVPRFRKRPGDVVLEGSNNSLVVLGTDRVGPISGLKVNEGQNNSVSPEPISEDNSGGSTGTIDIVVGRGQAPSTGGVIANTTTIAKSSESVDGHPIKQEINKEYDSLSPFEGDPDFRNDRSRVLVSQRTAVDRNFGLEAYNEQLKKVTVGEAHDFSSLPTGNASIVIKSDKVRLVSRSDVQLLVTGYKPDKNLSDKDVITEKNSAEDWASITITAEGSIVFKPSKKGYIKLGSEKADRAILCTSKPAIATSNGKVAAMPIMQPFAPINPGMATATVIMGDDTSGAIGNGVFASKVLVDFSDATYPSPSTPTSTQSGTPSQTSSAAANTVTSSPSKSSPASQPSYPPEIKIPPGAILSPAAPGLQGFSKEISVIQPPATTFQNYASSIKSGNSTPAFLSQNTSFKPPPTNNLMSQAKNDGIVKSTIDDPDNTASSVISNLRNQDTIKDQLGKTVQGLDPRYNKSKYSEK